MLYVGNAFFEMELEGITPPDLLSAFKMNPIIEQLQYLPLLYLEPEATLLVTEYPSPEYLEHLRSYGISPQMVTEEDMSKHSFQKVTSWGASDLVAKWAKGLSKSLPYEAPSLDVARRMNSKLYHFEHSPKLAFSAIVSKGELLKAIQHPIHKWVLKTDQGFSGRGHCLFTQDTLEKALSFLSQHKKAVLEPWVDRLYDFSSQWFVSKSGELTLSGVTKCINTPHGIYQGTETGVEHNSFIEEHLEFCKSYLKQHLNGYFGALGVDAMVYMADEPTLHPLVEVNARMTLSHALLLYFKRYLNKPSCRFLFRSCNKGTIGLLPFVYKRQLTVEE